MFEPFDSLLTRLARTAIEPLGYEVVGVELLAHGPRNSTLRVYIDHGRGITLEDCEAASHQLSGLLDVEDPLPEHYRLEVSSPGLDRPLIAPAHFVRFAGCPIKVRLRDKLDGRRRLEGTLRGCDEGLVRLEEGERMWKIPLDAIETARLVPPVD